MDPDNAIQNLGKLRNPRDRDMLTAVVWGLANLIREPAMASSTSGRDR